MATKPVEVLLSEFRFYYRADWFIAPSYNQIQWVTDPKSELTLRDQRILQDQYAAYWSSEMNAYQYAIAKLPDAHDLGVDLLVHVLEELPSMQGRLLLETRLLNHLLSQGKHYVAVFNAVATAIYTRGYYYGTLDGKQPLSIEPAKNVRDAKKLHSDYHPADYGGSMVDLYQATKNDDLLYAYTRSILAREILGIHHTSLLFLHSITRHARVVYNPFNILEVALIQIYVDVFVHRTVSYFVRSNGIYLGNELIIPRTIKGAMIEFIKHRIEEFAHFFLSQEPSRPQRTEDITILPYDYDVSQFEPRVFLAPSMTLYLLPSKVGVDASLEFDRHDTVIQAGFSYMGVKGYSIFKQFYPVWVYQRPVVPSVMVHPFVGPTYRSEFPPMIMGKTVPGISLDRIEYHEAPIHFLSKTECIFGSTYPTFTTAGSLQISISPFYFYGRIRVIPLYFLETDLPISSVTGPNHLVHYFDREDIQTQLCLLEVIAVDGPSTPIADCRLHKVSDDIHYLVVGREVPEEVWSILASFPMRPFIREIAFPRRTLTAWSLRTYWHRFYRPKWPAQSVYQQDGVQFEWSEQVMDTTGLPVRLITEPLRMPNLWGLCQPYSGACEHFDEVPYQTSYFTSLPHLQSASLLLRQQGRVFEYQTEEISIVVDWNRRWSFPIDWPAPSLPGTYRINLKTRMIQQVFDQVSMSPDEITTVLQSSLQGAPMEASLQGAPILLTMDTPPEPPKQTYWIPEGYELTGSVSHARIIGRALLQVANPRDRQGLLEWSDTPSQIRFEGTNQGESLPASSIEKGTLLVVPKILPMVPMKEDPIAIQILDDGEDWKVRIREKVKGRVRIQVFGQSYWGTTQAKDRMNLLLTITQFQ